MMGVKTAGPAIHPKRLPYTMCPMSEPMTAFMPPILELKKPPPIIGITILLYRILPGQFWAKGIYWGLIL